ncbi:MAG: hypothetical protein ACW99L_13990 [Promethearchaeota archaeon]|jgi:hypothetical protein
MVVATQVNALESGKIKMIDLIANGEDNLNPLNQQFIMTKIKYDEASDLYLGQILFDEGKAQGWHRCENRVF